LPCFEVDANGVKWRIAEGQRPNRLQDGPRHLHVTQEGQQWIANQYAQVFTVEHAELRGCNTTHI